MAIIFADYKFVFGTRTVTHTHKTDSGNVADSVAYAEKQAIRVQDAAGAWLLSATDCVWRLPDAECTNEPREGDTITDDADHDSEVWTIQSAGMDELTAVWLCPCVKERE